MEEGGAASSGPSSSFEHTRVQLLVVRLGGLEHAFPVEDVIEVLRMVAVTPLPEAPAWVVGVINVRGRVIPVIDLRCRLGMLPREPDLSTPIVVAASDGSATGFVADDVVEVLSLPREALQPPDRQTGPAPAVSAVARHGDRLILVLDPRRLSDHSMSPRPPHRTAEIGAVDAQP